MARRWGCLIVVFLNSDRSTTRAGVVESSAGAVEKVRSRREDPIINGSALSEGWIGAARRHPFCSRRAVTVIPTHNGPIDTPFLPIEEGYHQRAGTVVTGASSGHRQGGVKSRSGLRPNEATVVTGVEMPQGLDDGQAGDNVGVCCRGRRRRGSGVVLAKRRASRRNEVQGRAIVGKEEAGGILPSSMGTGAVLSSGRPLDGGMN